MTGTTPSGQTTAQGAAAAQTKTVTKADLKAGTAITDSAGNPVGKIESVDAKGAVLNTGKVQVTIPLKSLVRGENGIMIGMSKAEIEAAAKPKAK